MCDRMQVLHHDRHGYVAECMGCARFQVAFGTVLVSVGEEEFMALADAVRERSVAFRDRVCPGEKVFHFATEAPGVRLVLCYAELETLDHMLTEARWIHGIYGTVTDPMT